MNHHQKSHNNSGMCMCVVCRVITIIRIISLIIVYIDCDDYACFKCSCIRKFEFIFTEKCILCNTSVKARY